MNTRSPRIVSFLPSATEMTCALGLADALVGITHECDYPDAVKGKAVVVRNVLPIERMSESEIDQAVAERLRNGQSLYEIDEGLLAELAPDLILTQNLCQVCAPSGNEVSHVLKSLPRKPEILWLTPKCLDEIFDNMRELGSATSRVQLAETLIAEGRARLEKVRTATSSLGKWPRVFCIEWIEPVYASGHWVPEMVAIAGGEDRLGQAKSDSIRILWETVLEYEPEVFVVMPCGFNLSQVVEHAKLLLEKPGWADIPAVRNGRVYAVDANSYFARPGPRVVEGTELLAHLFHPEAFDWSGPDSAYERLFSLANS